MDDDDLKLDEPFRASRPSGVLSSGSASRMGRFFAITAAIAGAGAAGYAIHAAMNDEPVSTPAEPVTDVPPEPAAEPPPATPPDVGPPPAEPKADVGGPLKLDVPDPWWNDPNTPPAATPGPDVEVPDWD